MRATRAALTLASALLAFLAMVAVCRLAGARVQPAIVAAILAIGLGRRAMPVGLAPIALAMLRIGAVSLAAVGAGWLLVHVPPVGAAVFIAAMSASVWLRNFGGIARSAGALIALPLIALLVVPVAPDPALAPALNLALAIGAGVVALIAVALVDAIARRFGLQRAIDEMAPRAERTERRPGLTPQTKMAIQLAVALGAAFVLGFALFPGHWGWAVLTAFIVCAGARGRGDAAYKAVLRLGGAVGGAVLAAGIALVWHAGGVVEAATIFVVLFLGLWLRDVNYAYWAGAMTLILALLASGDGEPEMRLLALRLEAILTGALCAVVASWFVLPIRTGSVVRRRLSDALVAFDAAIAAPEEERAPHVARFHARLDELDEVAPPLRWHRRVAGARAADDHPAHWIDLARGLRGHAALERDARERGAIRKAIGMSRRAIGNHGALEKSPDTPPIGAALASLHETLAARSSDPAAP